MITSCCRLAHPRASLVLRLESMGRIEKKRKQAGAAAGLAPARTINSVAEPSEDGVEVITPQPASRKKTSAPKPRSPPQDIGIAELLLGAGGVPLADAALVARAAGGALTAALCPESLRQACSHLSSVDERLAPLITLHGPPERLLAKTASENFATLAKSICFQQLATQAAAKIFQRVLDACGCAAAGILDPPSVMGTSIEDLRAAGLSGSKAAYIHDLARHFNEGLLSDEAISGMDAAALHTSLTAVKGIGPWTVDMHAMFHLGRPDVLPVGDLGVRRGMQVLYGLRDLPTPAQMEAVADRWRPWRSVGSYYMWRVEVLKAAKKMKKAGG